MRYADLEKANEHLVALQTLLDAGPGRNPETLAALELLAGSLTRSLSDAMCQEKLSDLRFYGAELFSGTPGARWARKPLTAAEYLRLQILKTLNALHARIGTIAAIRRAGGETFAMPHREKAA